MLDCGLCGFPKRFSLRSRGATSGVSESKLNSGEKGIKEPFPRPMFKIKGMFRQNLILSSRKTHQKTPSLVNTMSSPQVFKKVMVLGVSPRTLDTLDL